MISQEANVRRKRRKLQNTECTSLKILDHLVILILDSATLTQYFLLLRFLIQCMCPCKCRQTSEELMAFLSIWMLTMSKQMGSIMKFHIQCHTWDGHLCQQQKQVIRNILNIITNTETKTWNLTKRLTCSLRKNLERMFKDETF